ncbi:hypothetical protein EOD40_03700 [Flavobacterium sufflavum]|uniref:Outer membrane protein beta-barrel domain-containing protein n=1 Tax=Flavobacterium sufflavum TaxID=1921138 RepID=A0A437L051_9FLAO|nr:hypothetical protein [Flavobacterium sufflavum]RVT78351.1 hypothetical protein EOD40_03700 [Flavobacterium sufflavum]
MKTLACLLITVGFSWPLFAQFDQGSYTQFGVSVPLKENIDRDDDDSNWFTPNGLSLKFGEGIHFNKTISVGLNSGIDWVASKKLVVVPAFANLKISLKIDKEGFLYIQTDYGKSIILGRGNLHGDYKKISLGLEHIEGIAFFIELTQYGFSLDTPEKVTTVSLGISSIWFTKKSKNKADNADK